MPEKATIFYSWQSDLPSRTNRGFIEEALRLAAKAVHRSKAFEVEPVVDRDTKGAPGSPDILTTVLKKIEASLIFVADVSIVARSQNCRPCPNPNVLFELGYALKALGDASVIVVYNTAFGALTDLPFDLRGRRIAEYRLAPNEQPASARQQLTRTLQDALTEVADLRRQDVNYQRNSNFATELNSALIRVQLFGNQREKRRIDPWRDWISRECGELSQWLKDHAHAGVVVDLGLRERVESLASLLDEVRSHVHVSGRGDGFTQKVIAATGAAAALQKELTKKGPLTPEAKAEIVAMLIDQQKRLAGWIERVGGKDLYTSGGYDDFMAAVGEIGFQLGYISYFPFDWPEDASGEEIRGIGEVLHLIRLTEETSPHLRRDSIVKLVDSSEVKLRNFLQRARF